ncbi:hypothetical protein E2I00_005901 [Balaenoptera physalus]|uniref:Uncharacterized protein n=1 Tax=Balaenoptera physalus TaxID=9770 RepID=A0A6A1Q146_BALPH|nr:hypothetical protein E2I00_005901 [Balaenoptera physalus]
MWDSKPEVRPRPGQQYQGHVHETPAAITIVVVSNMHQTLEDMDFERRIQLITLNDNGHNAPCHPSHNWHYAICYRVEPSGMPKHTGV